ncbi:MAG: SRPBCC family protein [Actinomycetota bacterium]
MTEITRQVRIDAAPVDVAAALARSPWRGAMSIEPVGAGCRVTIAATVEPEPLALAMEETMLAEVCTLQRHFTGRSGLAEDRAARRVGQPGRIASTNQHWIRRRHTMTTINRSVTINRPAAEVWPALADFGGIATWNPNLKASKLTSSQETGEGTTRECQLLPLGTVQERITEWIEGRMLTIDIYEFQNVPAMRSSTAVIELEPQGDTTRVTMSLSYEVGLGPIGAGMNALGMRRQFEKAVTSLMAGLKHHVETGQPVDRKTAIPLAAVSG